MKSRKIIISTATVLCIAIVVAAVFFIKGCLSIHPELSDKYTVRFDSYEPFNTEISKEIIDILNAKCPMRRQYFTNKDYAKGAGVSADEKFELYILDESGARRLLCVCAQL